MPLMIRSTANAHNAGSWQPQTLLLQPVLLEEESDVSSTLSCGPAPRVLLLPVSNPKTGRPDRNPAVPMSGRLAEFVLGGRR